MSEKPIRAGDYPVTAKQIFLLLTVSCCFLLFGAMNGWTAVLPRLQEDHARYTVTDDEVAWLVSMTSLVMIVCSLVAGALTEWLGPRHLLLLTLPLNAGSCLLMALGSHKALLYVGRVGVAVSVSAVGVLVHPLIAEMSSTEIRGRISTVPEISGALGILFAFVLAAFTPWGMATALCALPPLLLFIPSFFVPESPYWLVRRGRLDEARASLRSLMGAEGDAEGELKALTQASSATQTSYREQLEVLRKGRNLRPVLLVLSLFVLRELGGRSAVFMYSVYIFQLAGVHLDPFLCTVLMGTSRLVGTCVSALTLDHLGRRPVLLVTTAVCGLCQVLAGVFLYLRVAGASWVPLAALLVYMASYGLGLGPVPWVLLGEMVPTPVRSLGSSIINFSNYVILFGINFTFLKIVSGMGLGPTLVVLGLITSVAGVVAWVWVPETRGVSLQELGVTFSARNNKKQQQEPLEFISIGSGKQTTAATESSLDAAAPPHKNSPSSSTTTYSSTLSLPHSSTTSLASSRDTLH